ncbi:DUF4007 family protein [Winogradskyella sediminis]|uniref:DUF4007 family protein n=1 Tax=Winogradskyella sediminis TaxID=1382466 RepID=UPI003AA9993F
MNSNNTVLRFSGHDTFHCKEQWILKGLQLVEIQRNRNVFREVETISRLGVGKNMVRSIQHWLRAFGLINDDLIPTDFANSLFLNEALDPYLEYEGSLWLLQYFICHSQYASIYRIIFSEYFLDKATNEFSESQIFRFINKRLKENEQKPVTDKTLESDFKVLIRSYVSPTKNQKTVEDDFNVPLLSLNLISDTGRQNDKGQTVFRVNKTNQSIPLEIFAYCLLTEFEGELAISFDNVRKSIGSYLCLSNDLLDEMLSQLPQRFNEFVYKDDAGIRQIQIKVNNVEFKNDMLRDYYELH